MVEDGDKLSIIPRDGLRQRFAAVLEAPEKASTHLRRFKLELDRDGFAEGENISTDKQLNRVTFGLENRSGDRHVTRLRLSVPSGEHYEVRQDGKMMRQVTSGDSDYPLEVLLEIDGASSVEISKTGQ